MNKLYKHSLKNGDCVIFKTNMPKDKIALLTAFPNQYRFIEYFKERGYQLVIYSIIK